ncbi:collagen alpha-1(X) chain-like [Engraulis encrasicolus]|uniref:collagen alpha-1(X) chain-like n=1 Tax=Engraulis encrasicolus TaxID=184585 RepID=UPI002FD5687E
MRAALSLMVLLFWMSGLQAQSTQTEVQTGGQTTGMMAVAEVCTQQDFSAELKELRDMVVELRIQNAVQESELTTLKTRLAASETEVISLRKDTASVAERLVATETDMEHMKKDTAAQLTDMTAGLIYLTKEHATLETRLVASETGVDNLEREIKDVPKVAFSAGLTDSGLIQSGSMDLNLVFSKVITNVGQAYSSTSGFFTAPVKGVYYFRFTVMDNLTSRWMAIRLYKNGQQVMYVSQHSGSGNNNYLSSGVTLQLEMSDEVNLRIAANYYLYSNFNHHSTFSGFLLFPL